MPTIEHIAAAIEHAPAWALIGLTVPSERLRRDARIAVAATLVAKLEAVQPDDANQLVLPLI